MPATLTLKNVPDALYESLKSAAAINRRSINSEAIFCLESMLNPASLSVEQRIEHARALRARFNGVVRAEDLDAMKREGRP